MKTKLLIGAIALSILMFTGCGGGGSSSSGSSTPPPVQPIDPNNPPLSNGYHEILLPGYTYTGSYGSIQEVYVAEEGELLFNLSTAQISFVLQDSNWDGYILPSTGKGVRITRTTTSSGGSNRVVLPAGQYYLLGSSYFPQLLEAITFSVQSNVLYNPLAQ